MTAHCWLCCMNNQWTQSERLLLVSEDLITCTWNVAIIHIVRVKDTASVELLQSTEVMKSGDKLTMVTLRSDDIYDGEYKIFGKCTYNPQCNQTDRGYAKFYSILYYLVSTEDSCYITCIFLMIIISNYVTPLPMHWPLLSCITPTFFAYFLECHPYIFLHLNF